MKNQRNAEDIADGNWEHILNAAGMDTAYFTYAEGPCPICGGNTRFRWRAKKEQGFCSHCPGPSTNGTVLNGFRILQHLLNTDFRGACDYIRKWSGDGNTDGGEQRPRLVRPTLAKRVEEDNTDELREKYRSIWKDSAAIEEGSSAWAYLMRRVPGLHEIPKVLRTHAGMEYWEMDEQNKYQMLGVFQTMISIAQGLDGRAVNVWRTYLDDEGFKAKVTSAKKGVGRFLQPSYAVRLVEPDDELAIAEGIETALNVWTMFGIPCWSVLNADGMRKFELPTGYERVRKIRIYADNDEPDKNGRRAGNDAAQLLKDKMRGQGKLCTIILPKATGFDFADIAVKLAA